MSLSQALNQFAQNLGRYRGMVDVLRGDNGIIIISRRTMTPREIMPDLTWKNVQRIHVIRIG